MVEKSANSDQDNHEKSSPVSAKDFENAILQIFNEAQNRGDAFIDITAGDLHRKVGGYPGPNHRMPVCCSVMRRMMGAGDVVLSEPPSGMGANLHIRYYLPRPAEKSGRKDYQARTGATSFPQELKHLYKEAELIGSGGFARVFKARRKDGRVVAVKIPLNLDEATGRSFLREITSWQRLAHRNIISLFDANILPIPYLELEYVEGGNLEDMGKPLEIAQACEIVFDIAEGLKYAHKQGIVHRDLKPHNVLLTKEQFPKITDWGLSRVIAESKSSSQYSFSPVYASPEHVSPKKFGKPDERTDIYQLGVIFYNLLTNELPFKGEDLTEIATAIALEEPVLPSSLNLEARKVEHIVLKCIAKKKEDRYQSAGELQKELAEFIKRDYKESLKLSLGAGDMKRSAFYCAELCLVHARFGDVKEALKFALDLKNYAGGEAKKDVDALVEGLKFRMESGLRIDEEMFNKMEVVLHQVKMGWGKAREKVEKDLLEKRRQEQEERRKQEDERLRKEKEEQEKRNRQREEEERVRKEQEEQENLRREEAHRRENEEQERLRRQKELEERAQRERKAREEAERRESERQKARQEEERLKRQREENKQIAKENNTTYRESYVPIYIAILVAVILISTGGYFMFQGTGSDETLKNSTSSSVDVSSTPIFALGAAQSTFNNSIGMEFVSIPAGEFDMGFPANEASKDEGPVHRVKIANGFYMGKYEVTQKQWREIMGNNPSDFKGDNLPVEQVSWNDAQEFIKKLNEKEGANKYRLPSEAEWEYAARAGITTTYYFSGDYGWYGFNSRGKTYEVGQKKPNQWGLYDTHGNVWEWVQDKWHDNYNGAPTDGSAWEGDGSDRVSRGRSWYGDAWDCSWTDRCSSIPDDRDNDIGFRLVMEINTDIIQTQNITPKVSLIASTADQKTFTSSIGMEFVQMPAGEFDMGSPSNENDTEPNEVPVHRVNISKPFYMGKYKVTQKQWSDVMGNNPSFVKGDDLPVEQVSWYDVQNFIKKLNEKEGTNKYRLPSEAEWEYAIRAGTNTTYFFGENRSELGDYAWLDGMHPVGKKKPNSWGLYDMRGNGLEWIQDIYHGFYGYNGAPTDGSAWEGVTSEGGVGSKRVLRGSRGCNSYNNNDFHCRSASRVGEAQGISARELGFRLVSDM